jgi:hypothetical protein
LSNTFKSLRTSLPALMLAATFTACGDGNTGNPDGDNPNPDDVQGECATRPTYTENVAACVPLATDYQPRVEGSANDSWAACISDGNTYHRIQESISTIARVEGFETIARLLWAPGKVPSPQAFVEARVKYAEAEGLDSRVQRREDIHYPPPANEAKCRDAGIPALYPDRCVGPAKLLPILNDAFVKGANNEQPLVQAARIEASLVWFLYVSALSEVTSCGDKLVDCDSVWAYYTGGTTRAAPIGLARYVKELAPETHERAYDATLAVRCWRDLDKAVPAANTTLQRQARAQLDTATLRGVAVIVRQRFQELTCTSGDVKQARWAFLKVMVPLMDRAARERDTTQADVLKAQVEKASPDEVDVPAAVAALDVLFDCP